MNSSKNMVYREVIQVSSTEEFLSYIQEYTMDTAHLFRESRLREAVRRLEEWLEK